MVTFASPRYSSGKRWMPWRAKDHGRAVSTMMIKPIRLYSLMKKTLCLLCLSALVLTPRLSLAWSEPHHAITKGAVEALPAWEKELLGDEGKTLASYYCTIPDLVQNRALLKDPGDAKFAQMESEPDKVYLLKLHLPAAEQAENLETLRYFVGKAVEALQAGKVPDAARFMGTICHMLEDFGSPSHTVPGDNMFTLLQEFMPPPETMKGKPMHGPIESGVFEVGLAGYHPKLLGNTVDEAAWRLLHREHEAILNARSTTIPILQALYVGDAAAVQTNQLKAATVDAQVVADALHTILCLGAQKFEAGEVESLRAVHIAAHWPVEAVNLYYPQTQFFSSPNWGHAQVGIVMDGGTKPVPARLRISENGGVVEKEIANGISTGMGKPLTYLLPKQVYQHFTVRAGLQSGLSERGSVQFSVLGDGKVLATEVVNDGEAAHVLECDVSGVTLLQLAVVSHGIDHKTNYAIWAEPMLEKK